MSASVLQRYQENRLRLLAAHQQRYESVMKTSGETVSILDRGGPLDASLPLDVIAASLAGGILGSHPTPAKPEQAVTLYEEVLSELIKRSAPSREPR